MADDVLQIISDACDELGISRPNSLANPATDDDRQYAAVTNVAATKIALEPDTGWEILQRLHLFYSVEGSAEYDLPEDYGRLTIDTVWDRSQLTPMQGPLSPALWQTIKSGLIGNGIYFTRYRVVRSSTVPKKVFVVDPNSPNTGSPLVYEYQSTQVFCSDDYTTSSVKIAADTDLYLLPEELLKLAFKWRWRREQGLEFSTYLEEYNQELDKYTARDRPQPGFSLTGPMYRQNFLGWFNIPDTGYGS